MMNVSAKKAYLSAQKTDILIIGFDKDSSELTGEAAEIDRTLSGKLSQIIKSGEFKGKRNQMTMVHVFGELPAKRILLLGLDEKSKVNAEVIRKSIALAFRCMKKISAESCAVSYSNLKNYGLSPVEAARAVTEGALLGSYKFDLYKSKHDNGTEVSELTITTPEEPEVAGLEKGIEIGSVIGDTVKKARNLGNQPANMLTPTRLSEIAMEMDRQNGITCTVYERADIEKMGMGSFIAVGKGSDEPLKLIKLEYKPENRVNIKPLVLAGKAITFDSGGISIKPSEDMHKMKDDMSGGAAVLCVVEAAARMKLPVHIIGVVPACENMPGGKATKPGDVVRTMSGKTIEIQNTDAEGRLILADALCLAGTYDPEFIIDVATLTGACVIALGNITIGLLSNSPELIGKLKDASAKSGERLWEMPMYDEYRDAMDSDIADIRNVGGRPGGTITAAKFLEDFVDKRPWAHLDIAGTSWSDSESGYLSKGVTGSGIRVLLQFLMDFGQK